MPDDLVMLHASVRAVGSLLGGPDILIHALVDVVGQGGTVMMYVDWEDAAQHLTGHAVAESLDPQILDAFPPFDPRTSRARRAYGILPEFLRTWPTSYRSGNPDASVTAVGNNAEWVCRDHPLHYGYGLGSPLAKLVEAQGKVLLLGSPLENVTLLHYVEHMAQLPNKRTIRYQEPLLINGVKQWVTIEEFDTGNPIVAEAWEGYFGDVVRGYLSTGKGQAGKVGQAQSYLFDAADLYRYAVAWMEHRWGT
jgi:aminoglycoside 3-N-acetyltransferase